MTNLINTIYETGEWPKDFIEVATSYKMQRPLQNQPYRTYSKDSSKDTLRKDWKENWGCTQRRSVWI